jgi:hypothetical protein
MKHDLAEQVSQELRSCSGKLDKSIILIQGLVEEDAFKLYCRQVGKIMAEFYLEFLREIYTQYPDLEPESIRSGGTASQRGID